MENTECINLLYSLYSYSYIYLAHSINISTELLYLLYIMLHYIILIIQSVYSFTIIYLSIKVNLVISFTTNTWL